MWMLLGFILKLKSGVGVANQLSGESDCLNALGNFDLTPYFSDQLWFKTVLGSVLEETIRLNVGLNRTRALLGLELEYNPKPMTHYVIHCVVINCRCN